MNLNYNCIRFFLFMLDCYLLIHQMMLHVSKHRAAFVHLCCVCSCVDTSAWKTNRHTGAQAVPHSFIFKTELNVLAEGTFQERNRERIFVEGQKYEIAFGRWKVREPIESNVE